jgi:cholesterol transport system auxiliary component
MSKNNKALLPVLISLLLFLLLPGCMRFSRRSPKRNKYILQINKDVYGNKKNTAHSETNDLAIEVKPFHVNAKFARKEFVYRNSVNKFESDYYNIFFVNPSDLITEEIILWLQNDDKFTFVASEFSRFSAQYTLEGTVTELYGDFASGSGAAVLGINLYIIKESSTHPKIVFNKRYHKKVSIQQRTPAALIEGWNNAFEQILRQFSSDINTQLSL